MELTVKRSMTNDHTQVNKKGLNDTLGEKSKYFPMTVEEIGKIDSEYLIFLHSEDYVSFKDEVIEKLFAKALKRELRYLSNEVRWLYEN